MKRTVTSALIALIILTGTLILGIVAGTKYPIQHTATRALKSWIANYLRSTGQLERAARLLYDRDDIEYIDNIHPDAFKTDPAALIRIDGSGTARETRQALLKYIWKNSSGEVASLPIEIERDRLDSRYADLQNLERIDCITVRDPIGFDSVVYNFRPRGDVAGVVFYHQGHRGDFIQGKPTIQRFLSQNYAVFGFAMPALGGRPIWRRLVAC